jgi:hypothetical protein
MKYASPAVEVKTLRVEPKLTKREAAQLKKDKVQVDSSHIDVWVKDETVRYEKPDGSTLFTLIAKEDVPWLPESDAAYGIYREVAKNLPSRAAALGLPVKRGRKKDGSLDLVSRVDRNHPRLQYARDGYMGAMDPRKKLVPWTRLSKYDVNLIPPALAHTQMLDGLYADFEPESYQRQFAALQQVHPHWTIRGTAFSTVTCNWCFPTFPHVESGDFKPGLGVITVKYIGDCQDSWLVFVRWRVAVLVKEGQVLLADVGKEIHSNTEIPIHTGYGATSGRLATIHYFRPKLVLSGTPAQEAEKREAHLESIEKRRAK